MERQQALPNLQGKKILITGGLGFIGSNLAHKCVSLGAEVSIIDCLDPHSGGALFNIADIRDRITLSTSNLLDFDQLTAIILDKDIVINCAASTSHSFSMREPWLDQDANSKVMINILEALRRFNPSARFIHLGTTTQLGKLQYYPADEKHPEFPTDIYSANKSVSEKYALIYANAHNLKTTVLRLSNVFGPRSSINSSEFTFNNYFIGLALQNKTITVFGEGKQKRNIIFVDDAVNAIIITSQADQTIGEVYFVAGDKHYSVAEIAQKTVEKIGSGTFQSISWPVGRQKVDVGDAIISNAKFKQAVAWQTVDDLKSGLTKTKNFYQYCLDKYIR